MNNQVLCNKSQSFRARLDGESCEVHFDYYSGSHVTKLSCYCGQS